MDATPPTCAVHIDCNAAWTNVPTVTLDLSGSSDATSGLDVMAFSNDHATWTGWQTFALSRTWTLTNGDGTKTVWARLRDRAGHVSECQDDIGLDTTPPTGVTIQATVNGTPIALTWNANTSVADLHHYDVDVSADSGGWTSVVSNTTATSTNPTLPTGHRYTFRVTVRQCGQCGFRADDGPRQEREKYYTFGGKRVAMRADGVVYFAAGKVYLHSDRFAWAAQSPVAPPGQVAAWTQ